MFYSTKILRLLAVSLVVLTEAPSENLHCQPEPINVKTRTKTRCQIKKSVILGRKKGFLMEEMMPCA